MNFPKSKNYYCKHVIKYRVSLLILLSILLTIYYFCISLYVITTFVQLSLYYKQWYRTIIIFFGGGGSHIQGYYSPPGVRILNT